jgi:hypothetical protein
MFRLIQSTYCILRGQEPLLSCKRVLKRMKHFKYLKNPSIYDFRYMNLDAIMKSFDLSILLLS